MDSALVPLLDGTTFDFSTLPSDTVVALDVSGGPGYDFSELLHGIFDACVGLGLDVVTFDHELHAFRSEQVGANGNLRVGGGTDLRPVVMYVEANRDHASRVVVVTDGFAVPVQPALPERWTWLLVPDSVGEASWLSEEPAMQIMRLQ